MNFLSDLLPIIFFFGVFKYAEANSAASADWLNSILSTGVTPELAPIMLATATAIFVSIVQIVLLVSRGRPVKPMVWISLVLVLVFGGMTLYFQNETFIKWKPTILYWLFAGILLYGRIRGRNFVAELLTKESDEELANIPRAIWDKVATLATEFFIAIGVLNLIVAYSFSTDFWVSFKLFGLAGLTLLFTFGIAFLIARDQRDRQN